MSTAEVAVVSSQRKKMEPQTAECRYSVKVDAVGSLHTLSDPDSRACRRGPFISTRDPRVRVHVNIRVCIDVRVRSCVVCVGVSSEIKIRLLTRARLASSTEDRGERKPLASSVQIALHSSADEIDSPGLTSAGPSFVSTTQDKQAGRGRGKPTHWEAQLERSKIKITCASCREAATLLRSVAAALPPTREVSLTPYLAATARRCSACVHDL